MSRPKSTRNRTELHNESVSGIPDIRKTGPQLWERERRINNQVYTSTTTLAYTTISAITANLYRGCVQLFDGRVMLVPKGDNTAAIRYFNTNTNTITVASYGLRRARTGAVLNDGRVYFLPYTSGALAATQAFIFNPTNNTFTTSSATYESITGVSPNVGQRTACLLASGEVFVIGSGSEGNGAYVYNPVNDSLRVISSAPSRGVWVTTLLPDGRVYCFPQGGGAPALYQTAYIYNPTDDTFMTASTTLSSTANNQYAQALTMLDGRVLITPADGGTGSYYDPQNDTFTRAFITTTGANFSRGAMLLRDGRVYVIPNNTVGGGGRIFNPVTGTVTNGPSGFDNGNGAAACLMYDGRVLLAPHNTTSWSVFGDRLPTDQFLPPERVHSVFSGNRIVSNWYGT